MIIERRFYMNGSQVIKQLMLESDTSINQLAELLGIQPQSVRNKLSRNSFSLSEFEKVINLLNADLQVVSRKTKNIYH
nr:MAG TPA: Regulatory protein [Caudoviricetes sp.]